MLGGFGWAETRISLAAKARGLQVCRGAVARQTGGSAW